MAMTRPSIMSEGATMSGRLAHGTALPGQEFEGRVIVHIAVPDDAAVAVIRILAQADISDDRQSRHVFLDRPDVSWMMPSSA